MRTIVAAAKLLRAEFGRTTPRPDPSQVALLRARLVAGARRRSAGTLSLLSLDTGCCGACAASVEELRLLRLGAGGFGLRFVERPVHADVLLVTGLAVRNAMPALRRSWEAMGPGAIAVAVGDCAGGGVPEGGAPYAVTGGGAASLLPVDLAIRGAPPAPDQILLGLLTLRDAAAP